MKCASPACGYLRTGADLKIEHLWKPTRISSCVFCPFYWLFSVIFASSPADLYVFENSHFQNLRSAISISPSQKWCPFFVFGSFPVMKWFWRISICKILFGQFYQVVFPSLNRWPYSILVQILAEYLLFWYEIFSKVDLFIHLKLLFSQILANLGLRAAFAKVHSNVFASPTRESIFLCYYLWVLSFLAFFCNFSCVFTLQFHLPIFFHNHWPWFIPYPAAFLAPALYFLFLLDFYRKIHFWKIVVFDQNWPVRTSISHHRLHGLDFSIYNEELYLLDPCWES